MNDKNENIKYYFAPVKKDDITVVMNKIASKSVEVFLWKKGKEDKAETFIVQSFNEKNKFLYLKASNGILKNIIQSSLSNKEILIKFIYNGLFYFSYGTLNFSPENTLYSIKIEHQLYLSQQRKNYRLNSSKFINIKLKIDDEIFPCLDLSTGGTCFIIPKEYKKRFSKGAIFRQCIINLNRRNFDIHSVEIMGLFEMKTPPEGIKGLESKTDLKDKIKIPARFHNLSSEVDVDLCQYINTEARGEEIMKMLS